MNWLFTILLISIPMWGCQPHEEEDLQRDPAPYEEDFVPEDEIGNSTQGLVWVDGQLVPECSTFNSKCLNGVDYVYCVSSVENPGAEEWLPGGSCNSGYRCEQQGEN